MAKQVEKEVSSACQEHLLFNGSLFGVGHPVRLAPTDFRTMLARLNVKAYQQPWPIAAMDRGGRFMVVRRGSPLSDRLACLGGTRASSAFAAAWGGAAF